MDTSEIAAKLREAARLIQKGWCKGTYAKGKSGRDVLPDSPRATEFCAVGAIRRVAPHTYPEVHRALRLYLREWVGAGGVTFWNDAPERTKTQVVRAFRDAAKAVEAGEVK